MNDWYFTYVSVSRIKYRVENLISRSRYGFVTTNRTDPHQISGAVLQELNALGAQWTNSTEPVPGHSTESTLSVATELLAKWTAALKKPISQWTAADPARVKTDDSGYAPSVRLVHVSEIAPLIPHAQMLQYKVGYPDASLVAVKDEASRRYWMDGAGAKTHTKSSARIA